MNAWKYTPTSAAPENPLDWYRDCVILSTRPANHRVHTANCKGVVLRGHQIIVVIVTR